MSKKIINLKIYLELIFFFINFNSNNSKKMEKVLRL